MKRFSVAIPASVVSDTPHLREKTAKLGAIARACSIFGVTEIILYPDDPHSDQGADLQFCSDILGYIETPQYLRRRLFKLSPTFQFTGILPPLQTPPHNVPSSASQLKVGDLRDGVVVGRSRLKCEGRCWTKGNYRMPRQLSHRRKSDTSTHRPW